MKKYSVVVGEPGEFYLTHVNPENGRGKSIAAAIYDAIRETSLDGKLIVIGSDGTASMTGANRGAIRCMEMIGRPLQWVIGMLHCSELPLRHSLLNSMGHLSDQMLL